MLSVTEMTSGLIVIQSSTCSDTFTPDRRESSLFNLSYALDSLQPALNGVKVTNIERIELLKIVSGMNLITWNSLLTLHKSSCGSNLQCVSELFLKLQPSNMSLYK